MSRTLQASSAVAIDPAERTLVPYAIKTKCKGRLCRHHRIIPFKKQVYHTSTGSFKKSYKSKTSTYLQLTKLTTGIGNLTHN
jgi:hypothetical protein